MGAGLRKLVLSVHLTFSVGWVGAVIAYLALGIAATASRVDETVRASLIAMELTGWYAIVPLALLSLVTGIVVALGGKWGLFRHYWVSFSLVLTVVAAVVLLLHMPTVTSTANLARVASGAQLHALGGDLAHPAIGLVVLLVVQFLNLYKPKGMTRYGQRKSVTRARR